MTDLEIEISKWQRDMWRYYLRGLVRSGTPSRLGVYAEGRLLWDHACDRKTSLVVMRDELNKTAKREMR